MMPDSHRSAVSKRQKKELCKDKRRKGGANSLSVAPFLPICRPCLAKGSLSVAYILPDCRGELPLPSVRSYLFVAR